MQHTNTEPSGSTPGGIHTLAGPLGMDGFTVLYKAMDQARFDCLFDLQGVLNRTEFVSFCQPYRQAQQDQGHVPFHSRPKRGQEIRCLGKTTRQRGICDHSPDCNSKQRHRSNAPSRSPARFLASSEWPELICHCRAID